MEVAGVANVELRLLGRSHEAPREDRPPPRMEPVDPEAGEFDVQIGAFTDPANAYRLRQRMLQTWPAVHVVRYLDPRSGQLFHRVRVGPLDGSRRADEAKLQLEGEGFEPFIVRHDPNE
jgi:cell division protein FtsN